MAEQSVEQRLQALEQHLRVTSFMATVHEIVLTQLLVDSLGSAATAEAFRDRVAIMAANYFDGDLTFPANRKVADLAEGFAQQVADILEAARASANAPRQ